MKNQIQIASEPKDSKLASTLAHETRKNNESRKLFLSLCVVVALAVAMTFTSCNPDDNGDPDVDEFALAFDPSITGNFDGTITATVENVNHSINRVRAFIWSIDGYTTITLSSTDYDGGFSLTLPQSVDEQYLQPVTNFNNFSPLLNPGINISDNAKIARIESFWAYSSASGDFGWADFLGDFYHVKEEGLSQTFEKYIYSDRDVVITGSAQTVTMEGYPATRNYWISLGTGWNLVYEIFRMSRNNKLTITMTTIPIDGLYWDFIEDIE